MKNFYFFAVMMFLGLWHEALLLYKILESSTCHDKKTSKFTGHPHRCEGGPIPSVVELSSLMPDMHINTVNIHTLS